MPHCLANGGVVSDPLAEADQPNFSTGSMLALYPPRVLVEALALPGGLPVDELHLTLAYTGKAADVDAEALKVAAKALARRDPIEARISGHARFTGGEDGDVIVALIDSPALEQLRRDTLDQLAGQGIEIPRDHGYCAHMTLAYLPVDEPSPIGRLDNQPIAFTALSAVHGDDRTDEPFDQPDAALVAAAREAYAAGWALSGGPMTDRVRAGSVAAIDMACEHADDPHILEVTLQLGSLEGAWALVYDRREQLIADHVEKVTAIWRAITKHLDVDAMVARLREQAGLREAVNPQTLAEATAAAQRLLRGVLDDNRYTDLRDAVTDALLAGAAEGCAAALAVAAEQQPTESRFGTIGFDFDLAFQHAYDTLDRADFPPDPWIARILAGNANDVGHILADLIAEGAPYDDMVDAVRGLTGSTDIRAVRTFIDQAVSAALNRGAVDLYTSEGVRQYDVLTAGDTRVCPRCVQIEGDNPYPVSTQPLVPSHPLCRCAVAPVTPLPSTAFAPYLPSEDQ
jgi:SPP1 gp7 family putative phage head morphogenesis protein